ncbi:hypothetical protein PDESU_05799 [Pontiella desulfatans]|uniref:Uncharacterized protein n=1 Tax=Pontiella desulfatans TaxID=2750659 RepID=A0A6C2UBF7_PONDE|nr:hypothetical protein PDESU_05799 [Pontiella desulfatans]
MHIGHPAFLPTPTQQTRSEPATQNTVTFPADLRRTARRPLFLPVRDGSRPHHLRWPSCIPLLTVIHKVHLALLRVTPQAPRNGGMYAALSAKEEIVHPASIVDPSTPSAAKWRVGFHPVLCSVAVAGIDDSGRRCPFPVSSFSFLHKFSFVSAVWVAAITATSRFSRLCIPLAGQPRRGR